MYDLISRRVAINELWKALFEYEDKTEKQFEESEDLDVGEWFIHRIFVQNMNDIDRHTILNLPAAQPTNGRWIDKYGDGDWHCSRCGAIVEKHEQDYRNWYFCYHCGAKMDEKPCDDCQEFDCYGCEYAERKEE